MVADKAVEFISGNEELCDIIYIEDQKTYSSKPLLTYNEVIQTYVNGYINGYKDGYIKGMSTTLDREMYIMKDELVLSEIKDLRSEIKELRSEMNTNFVKVNDKLNVIDGRVIKIETATDIKTVKKKEKTDRTWTFISIAVTGIVVYFLDNLSSIINLLK